MATPQFLFRGSSLRIALFLLRVPADRLAFVDHLPSPRLLLSRPPSLLPLLDAVQICRALCVETFDRVCRSLRSRRRCPLRPTCCAGPPHRASRPPCPTPSTLPLALTSKEANAALHPRALYPPSCRRARSAGSLPLRLVGAEPAHLRVALAPDGAARHHRPCRLAVRPCRVGGLFLRLGRCTVRPLRPTPSLPGARCPPLGLI